MFAGFILTLLILWKEKMSSPRRKAASSSHYSPEPSSRRPAQAYPSEKEVDEIMEKISRSGLSSLTEEEQEARPARFGAELFVRYFYIFRYFPSFLPSIS